MDQAFTYQNTDKTEKSRKSTGSRQPATYSVDPLIWICGSKLNTQKRLQQLGNPSSGGVINLKLIDIEQLPAQVAKMQESMVGLLNGTLEIPIGDTSMQHRCQYGMACERGASGEHGFSHCPEYWIMWHLLSHVYTCDNKNTPLEEPEEDVFDIISVQSNTYKHVDTDTGGFSIHCKARTNIDLKKVQNVFEVVLPAFFAGQRSLPRIGNFVGSEEHTTTYCHGAFCKRTLPASNMYDVHTACNRFHKDENSICSTLARILLETTRISKPFEKKDKYKKVQVKDLKEDDKDGKGAWDTAKRGKKVKQAAVKIETLHNNMFTGLTLSPPATRSPSPAKPDASPSPVSGLLVSDPESPPA